MRKTYKVLVITVLLLTGFHFFAIAKSSGVITAQLGQQIETVTPGEMIRINITLSNQYDSQLLLSQAKTMRGEERRQYVINVLKDFSRLSQEGVIADLNRMQRDKTVKQVTTYWIANVINCWATPAAIEELAKRNDIAEIDHDEMRVVIDPSENRNAFYEEGNPGNHEITWNILKINADDVWALGFNGDGIIVSVIDTGVNYNHVDLADHVWTDPNYPYHGFDFANNDNNPMDDHGHGTHCSGTVAGDGTAGSQTGVAPEATIMCCKVLDAGGGGQESSVWSAVEFSVEHGAHVMSLSLGWQHSWGANRTVWRQTFNNSLAAGIIASVLAGNEGDQQGSYPIPDNVRTPGDLPPAWLHPDQTLVGGISGIICVGATDINDNLAGFSSRGPMDWSAISPFNDYPYQPEMGLIRPDVSAPGVNIKSLDYSSNTGYASGWDGTSMATPANAGLIALMLQKNNLLTPEEIDETIETTTHVLVAGKNNNSGSGRIDALAALEATSMPGPSYYSHAINDLSGNNNGQLDPAESVFLGLSMGNFSDEPADNVTVELSTESTFITITDNTEFFGNFGLESIIEIQDAFAFDVANNVPGGEPIKFNILAYNSEESWESSFETTANGVNLVAGLMTISDISGNNNGNLDPGEMAEIHIQISNTGQIDAPAAMAYLTSASNFVSVITATFDLQTLASGQSSTAIFTITINPSTPIGTVVDLNFEAVSGYYFVQKSFNPKVGLVVEDFETGNFSQYEWQFAGNANWTVVGSGAYEGTYCAKSGAIGNSATTEMKLTIDVAANDSIAFYRKVSSEATYDFLEFYIDNSLKDSWSGEVAWGRVAFPVTAGEHSFRWVYMKDVYVVSGSDCAWVDYIELPTNLDTNIALTAGPDIEICQNQTAQMYAFAVNAVSYLWTTQGDGTFSDPTALNPFYTPGNQDISTGSALLTITASDASGETLSDDLTIFITNLPIVWAGEDFAVCADVEPFVLENANPPGGFYTGAGVTNGIFDPATAGVGSHLIHYSYTSPEGCTNVCSFNVTVNALPVMICPENMEVCEDVPQLALPAAFPEGGTYSGATIENGWFYPSLAGVGVHEISYSFIDENGCSNGCQFQVTVHPLPEMTCPADFGMCVDAGLIGLPQALPLGGTYSGNGVEGTLFNPALAGVGVHPVTYLFTDSEGCTNACGFDITVNPLPVLTCPQDMEFCISDEPVALVGALPLGGTFEGTGIEAGVFIPAIAGVGLHPVVYSYTDLYGCFNTCNFTIEVHPLPVITCPSDTIVCVSSAPFALTEALPSGGIYTGQGVVNGTFNPQLAGTGSHIIVYTFTDENTCTASCSFTIIVKPLPVVSCPGNFAVCQNDAPFLLTGGSPAGGDYSGTGVIQGMFYPGNVTTGVKNITYTYQDQFGCANSCLFKITVLPVPVVTCPGDLEVCLNEPPFEIVGLSPTDGELTGPGINGTVFDAQIAGVGNHEITYNYTSPVNFCSNACTFTITVFPLPELSCGANLTFCLNDDPMVLNVATPTGGIYSGTGVEQGIFYPDLAGVGVHEMMYTYTSPENGCTHLCSFAATVLELPEITCVPDFSVCLNEEPFLLDQAAPFGGTYTGTGVEENIFNPSIAGVGKHEITYVYTSPLTLCSNSCSFFIDVLPLPELTCGLPVEVCYNDLPLVLDYASPPGGDYSGAGVENGIFYPESAGVGNHEIVYSYTSPENSCTNTCAFTITVKPLPTLTCGADLEICLNEAPLLLQNALPTGGFYSGTGVEGGVFDPLAAGVGTHDIFYQLTGENGCSSTCQFQITVLPVPEMSCPENIGICVYEDPFVLNMASPPGGVYTGEGVEGNIFNPATAGVGEHPIEYTFANEFGCSESCNFIIAVYPVPEIICDFPQQVCLYDGPIAMSDCNPGGGTYQGTGVAGNTFFPEIAGVGEHEITYFFVHPETGCENQTTFEIEVLPAQLVNLPNGWSGISSYMIPKNPEIPEIFTDLGNKLVILYNLNGTIYYPGENIIPHELWDSYSGYAMKTTQPVTMDFCGEYLQNLTVPLSQGWNLIPMLSKNPVSSEYLFGFNSNVKIVKQVAGWKLYWKEMGINTLGFVNPGKAYYVYCSDETSVTFPYYFKDGGEQIREEEPIISPFEVVNPTPTTHILAFENLKTLRFSKGDVVAAFTSSGLCAGQVQVGDENPGLVMFGDDIYSEQQDGLMSGEKIIYRLYRHSDERTFDLKFSYDTKYQVGDYFQPEGISVVKEAKVSAVGLESMQANGVNIFPNPTTGVLHITGIEGSYRVEVFNMLEEQVMTLSLDGKSQLDLSEFPNGVYMVKIITGNVIITKKIALQ